MQNIRDPGSRSLAGMTDNFFILFILSRAEEFEALIVLRRNEDVRDLGSRSLAEMTDNFFILFILSRAKGSRENRSAPQ